MPSSDLHATAEGTDSNTKSWNVTAATNEARRHRHSGAPSEQDVGARGGRRRGRHCLDDCVKPADLDSGKMGEKEMAPDRAWQSTVNIGQEVKSLDALAETVEVRGLALDQASPSPLLQGSRPPPRRR